MRKPRLIPLFLALAMALSITPAFAYSQDALVPQAKTYDTPFPDTQGTWCESYVQTVYEAGLMEGKTAQRFDPRGTLTNAQIVVITARFHKLLASDGQALAKSDPWYAPAYDYLLQTVFDGSYTMEDMVGDALPPAEPCTRSVFVWLLSEVLKERGIALPVRNQVSVLPDTSYAVVLDFYRAGILNGKDEYGSFDHSGTLTRGEAAAMLARLTDPSQRLTFTLQTFDLCRDVLGVDGSAPAVQVDGLTYTADQLANGLVNNLLVLYVQDQPMDLTALAEEYACSQAIVELLAKEKGITLSADELAAIRQSARDSAGLRGISEDGWAQGNRFYALLSALNDRYETLGGEDGLSQLLGDLTRMEGSLSPVASETIRSLDGKAVYQRALHSPLRYCYGYLFS